MRILIVVLLFLFNDVNGQKNKYSIKDNRRSEKVDFELFNNLIILPVVINGVELKFLVDTGVEKTILFSLEEAKDLKLNNTKRIKIRGLSSSDSYSAYKSTGNHVKIQNISNKNANVYLVFDKENYLTSSLGTVINGVIGYDLLQYFTLRFNYQLRTIKFYTPEKFHRPLLFFKEKSINLINKKPHVNASFSDVEVGGKQGNFLLDTGSSDAVWLYKEDRIQLPKKKFKDNLGFGFRGIISGYRSKIDKFKMAGYQFNKVNVAFPDVDNESIKQRVGSIGNKLLKRFRFFISYADGKIYFKSNSLLGREFNYDKSGLLFKYDGISIIEKQVPVRLKIQKNSDNSYDVTESEDSYNTVYEIKKKIRIARVRKNSPAGKAGILPEDVIVTLQDKSINKYDLEEVRTLMSSEEGKQIHLKVNRNGKIIKAAFKLNDRLN